MVKIDLEVAEVGVLLFREQKSTYHGDPIFGTVAHLPWWDGNTACGKVWSESVLIKKIPNPLIPERFCRVCVSKTAHDDGESPDLEAMSEQVNAVLRSWKGRKY